MDKNLVEESGDDSNDNEKKDVHVATALNLAWSFGINKDIPVLNLSNFKRKVLFYATSHTGVLYDFKNNEEILYQGHCNAISCTCVSQDKRWLATSEIGDECMLIIWDTEASIPIKTIFDVDVVGISKMAFSSCAKFIATLSCTCPQVLSLWDWTKESDVPVVSITIDEQFGLQTYVTFNSKDAFQLVTNNGNQIIFFKWDANGNITFHAPKLNDEDFNKTVGTYSQSVFHQKSSEAFTATSCGNIVVWTVQSPKKCFERKAFKIVRLQDKPITVLTLVSIFIVTGDAAGNVKFFDTDLKLVYWYDKLGCQGAINSISFTHTPEDKDNNNDLSKDGAYPTSSTLPASSFVVNDFSVSTTKANFLYFKTDGSTVEFSRRENDKDIKAIACHPKGPYIAIGGFGGLLQVLDFETKTLVHSRKLSGDCVRITCLTYNNTGDYLAIGFDDGRVEILDSVTLELDGHDDDVASFKFSHDSIIKLVFSHDSRFLACADMDRCVVVFTCGLKRKPSSWYYLGKHRAHYKQIKDVMFTKALDEDNVRLLSLGEDRMLVEYDLRNSCIDDLKVLSSDRVEQNAVPICFAAYPSVVKEDFLVLSNDQYKLKLFNSTTKMCRYTFLAPTYGSPLQKMVVLPKSSESTHRYMAYITIDMVGLIILPLDGNPYKSMALIAHPGKVHNIACSSDGKYLFTAGGADTSVLMWRIDVNALEATAVLGGEELIPFYSLLEGGREGELFAELENFFYYAQLKNEGVDSMEVRSVSTEVPLDEIPFIMRALGFYPTEQEIEEMINEVKFSHYVSTGRYKEAIDLSDFIKLYVNHRPAFGFNPYELIQAFQTLGDVDEEDGEVKIDRGLLLYLLQERGEHLTETELAEHITHLLQGSSDDDNNDGMSAQERGLDDILPEKISARSFASEILGLGVEEEVEVGSETS